MQSDDRKQRSKASGLYGIIRQPFSFGPRFTLVLPTADSGAARVAMVVSTSLSPGPRAGHGTPLG
jgi:hypothetical protein